jgi:hypothetical protein
MTAAEVENTSTNSELVNFRKIQRHKDSGIIGHLVLVSILLLW